MNMIAFRSTKASTPAGLNELLLELARYGRPRVSLVGQGWHASVEMNTNTTGTTFEVRSAFDHKTPDSAAAECAERVRTALKTLTATK